MDKKLIPYQHVAPVRGRDVLFANVEFDVTDKPDVIVLDGTEYVMVKAKDVDKIDTPVDK